METETTGNGIHVRIKFSYLGKNTQIPLWLATGAILCLFATPVLAALSLVGKEIPWGIMGMRLFGGLALFLFGMDQMSEALKAVAGNRMKEFLGNLTNNRITGLLTGAGVTAVIQSSSVTTVMLVGFVTAGMMSLSQAIGVILGADIGTTISMDCPICCPGTSTMKRPSAAYTRRQWAS